MRVPLTANCTRPCFICAELTWRCTRTRKCCWCPGVSRAPGQLTSRTSWTSPPRPRRPWPRFTAQTTRSDLLLNYCTLRQVIDFFLECYLFTNLNVCVRSDIKCLFFDKAYTNYYITFNWYTYKAPALTTTIHSRRFIGRLGEGDSGHQELFHPWVERSGFLWFLAASFTDRSYC